MKKLSLFLIFLFNIVYPVKVTGNHKSGLQPNSIALNTFTHIPKEIDGCAAYFYKSMADRRLDKYIEVNDFAILSYIKIGDKMVEFTQTKYVSSGGGKFKAIYQNKEKSIQLIIEIKSRKATGPESSVAIGTMTVKDNNGHVTSVNIVGDIAC